MLCFVTLISACCFISSISCHTKMWTYNLNISDPIHWQTVHKTDDCTGLVFAKEPYSSVTLPNLKVSSLSLPKNGFLQLKNTKIEFDVDSDDKLNCVELKSISPKIWTDFNYWINVDEPYNPAIPYVERLPSRYDDIVLLAGFNSGVAFSQNAVKSLSMRFGNMNVTIHKSLMAVDIQSLQLTNEECTDPTGCCVTYMDYFPPDRCKTYVSDKDKTIKCQEPIKPYGFCGIPKCGASILIRKLKRGFRLNKIVENLKGYDSFTHASKITEDPDQVQIFFTEDEFSGNSIVEATEFFHLISNDDSYFSDDIQLIISGPPLKKSSRHINNVISFTFGPLLVAVAIFALLFFVYSPSTANSNIRNRLLGRSPLTTYIMRYNNMEDRGCTIDGQSTAGSVLDLNSSFDNPMYENHSSGSTIVEEEAHHDDAIEEVLEEADGTDKENVLLKDF